MDTNPQPGAIELIRLADLAQSISVRLRSTEPAFETSGRRYYDADAIVTSGFVNGTVYLDSTQRTSQTWASFWTLLKKPSRRPASASRLRPTGLSQAADPVASAETSAGSACPSFS
jgi:hypothetical protein